jgi:integrase/recombinase XerD
MTNFTDLASVPSDTPVPRADPLRLAVAAYLARFKGSSREHTESDLRSFLTWCAERSLDPLAARRPHLELYIRWMQEIRRFKPSTVSRRFSVAAGFYRTCVIDGVLEHSPAEHVRRPAVPAESPTLGFTRLQFEALLTAARESAHPCDFALVAMLGLLGLRIFEATGGDLSDLGEEHGHRVLRVCGKGSKVVLVPLPPAVSRAIDRAAGTRTHGPILLNSRGARMDRHAATRRLRRLADAAGVRITRPHPHMLRHTFVTTMLDAGVDLRDVQIAARHADPRTTMRYDRARKNLDRHRCCVMKSQGDPGLHLLADRAIPRIAGVMAGRVVPWIAQVRGQLGLQRPLQHRLDQLTQHAALAGQPQPPGLVPRPLQQPVIDQLPQRTQPLRG